MNRPLSIFLLLFLSIVSSCRKPSEVVDKCKDIVCSNGGTCSEGVCLCPQGYSGNYCENILPGAANGNISPKIVATGAVLTSINTTDVYETGINAYGNFWFIDVKPGTYTLHINTISPYWPSPPDTNIIILPGDTTHAGYKTITHDEAAQGSVIFSIDSGPDHTLGDHDLIALFHSNYLRLTGREDTGVNATGYSIELHVLGVNSPGTYIIQQASYLEVRHYTSGSMDGFWKAGNSYPAATLTLSSVNTVTNQVSGTFSGTLSPVLQSLDSIHISGSFTDIYWLQ